MLCSNYNRLWGLQWLWPNFRLGDLWLHGSHCWRLWLGSWDLALGLWLSPWLLWCWLEDNKKPSLLPRYPISHPTLCQRSRCLRQTHNLK